MFIALQMARLGQLSDDLLQRAFQNSEQFGIHLPWNPGILHNISMSPLAL
jgi:hypothetical protein